MSQISRFWNGTTTGDAGTYSDTNFADVIEALTYNGKQTNSLAIGGIEGTASSGSYPLKVYENSPTALSVKVDKGAYWFLGRFYESTAVEIIIIDSNSSGNSRIDSIVLTKDYSAQTIRLGVVKGTPNASPTPPTLTQTIGTLYQYKLADITITSGATAIVNANISNTGHLYQYQSNVSTSASNVWMGYTDTAVLCSSSQTDINLGWSVTFTPTTSKVTMLLFPRMVYSYVSASGVYMQLGYKINGGSTNYITRKTGTTSGGFQMDDGQLIMVTDVAVNPYQSNTIAYYLKTGSNGGSYNFWAGSVLIKEQLN